MKLPTFSDMRTETPSFGHSAPGREFHRLDGANKRVQGQHPKSGPIRFVRRNNAKAQTWKKQLRSIGHRARLHGNELRLWSSCGQEGDDLSDSVCRRTWRNI